MFATQITHSNTPMVDRWARFHPETRIKTLTTAPPTLQEDSYMFYNITWSIIGIYQSVIKLLDLKKNKMEPDQSERDSLTGYKNTHSSVVNLLSTHLPWCVYRSDHLFTPGSSSSAISVCRRVHKGFRASVCGSQTQNYPCANTLTDVKPWGAPEALCGCSWRSE